MKFPLLLASGAAGGLDAVEAMLRQMTRPGAYVDLKPDGVASSEVVRFDVLGGRVNHDPYMVRLQEIGRRYVTVELDTQPYGYWPTWVLLASTASLGLPGSLDLPPASRLGDVPGLVLLAVTPTTMSSAGGSWIANTVAWSLGQASGAPLMYAPDTGATMSQGSAGSPTPLVDANSPAGSHTFGVDIGLNLLTTATAWLKLGAVNLRGTERPGMYRVFAWTKLTPSGANPLQMTIDYSAFSNAAMASANAIATIIPNLSSGPAAGVGAYGAVPSSAFVLNDMGLLTIPSIAGSLQATNAAFNLWVAGSSPGSALMSVAFGLLRVDGPAGAITNLTWVPPGGVRLQRGLGIRIDSSERSITAYDTSNPSTFIADLTANARGGMPAIGPSAARIDLIPGSIKIASTNVSAATTPHAHPGPEFATVGVYYRPRFSFLKGL
jgi:hypothetical protein